MEPIFFDFVYSLHNEAHSILPKFLNDRPMCTDFMMAAIGSFLITKTVQYVSKKYYNRHTFDFNKKYLPKIEKICQYGIPTLALLYSCIDPDGAKLILMQHPVYTAGMAGAFAGGFIAAEQDLNKRKSLENRL
jgi:hypothetical protein